MTATYIAKARFQEHDLVQGRRKKPGSGSEKVTNWLVAMAALIAQDGIIMDIACGNGRHYPQLSDVCRRVFAGDLSRPMLGMAREHFQCENLVCFDAEHLPFQDKAFDVVFSARFFHHLPTPELREHILTEAFRVSRKGVLFTCKAPFSLEFLKQKVKSILRGNWGHENRYYMSRSEVAQAAAAHGWRIADDFAPHPFFASNHAYVLEPVDKA